MTLLSYPVQENNMNPILLITMIICCSQIGDIKKPYRSKIIYLVVVGITIFILGAFWDGERDPMMLLIYILESLIFGTMGHLIKFHGDEKISLKKLFRKNKGDQDKHE